jgi:exonuclease III
MLSKDTLTIWQQNLNKSPTSQHDLISSNELTQIGIDIVVLQEPAINAFNCTIASRDWTTVYPTPHKGMPNKTRSVTLINLQLNTDTWTQLDFPSSDVTVVQLKGSWGKLTIFNIYNNGNNNETISALTKFYQSNCGVIGNEDETNARVIWLGDFNRHHPHWDDPSDT